MLMTVSCSICKDSFVTDSKPSRPKKCCSDECRTKARSLFMKVFHGKEEYLMTCCYCNVQFLFSDPPSRRIGGKNPRKYCSNYCRDMAKSESLRGRPVSFKSSQYLEIGTERVKISNRWSKKFGKSVRREVYVKVKRHRWKRKCIIVLEESFGRELSHAEKRCIRYIDGNYLNCEVSNLLVYSGTTTRVCSLCGDCKPIKVGQKSKWQGLCRACRSAVGILSRRKD